VSSQARAHPFTGLTVTTAASKVSSTAAGAIDKTARAWTKAEAKKVLDQLLAHGCGSSKKVWRKVSLHQICYWVLCFCSVCSSWYM